MRSISSTLGQPLLEQAQRLEAERAAAAVDEEAGAVGGVDDPLAHRLAERRGPARSPRPRTRIAGDHLDEPHHRRRVEEVHADDALGSRHAGGDRVTGIDEVLVASTHVVGHDSRQRGEQLALELERLGRRLDHQVARRERLELSVASSRAAAAARSSRRHPPARGAFSSPRAHRFGAARQGVGDRGRAAACARPPGTPSCAMPEPIVPGADDADGRHAPSGHAAR